VFRFHAEPRPVTEIQTSSWIGPQGLALRQFAAQRRGCSGEPEASQIRLLTAEIWLQVPFVQGRFSLPHCPARSVREQASPSQPQSARYRTLRCPGPRRIRASPPLFFAAVRPPPGAPRESCLTACLLPHFLTAARSLRPESCSPHPACSSFRAV
jgi:hypothetical protein